MSKPAKKRHVGAGVDFKPAIKGRDGTKRPTYVPDAYSDCWICTGKKTRHGYPMLNSQPAHRVMYEAVYGAIPFGFEVHHLCERRDCCNPDHLVIVTRLDHRKLDESKRRERDSVNRAA